MQTLAEMMTTQEVAAYLRIKERKVYDLVKEGRIPCRRVTGKWLFPRTLIDAWLEGGETLAQPLPDSSTPPVIAGSQDPLLDWCLRESDCGLAMMPLGSLEGLKRFVAGKARLATCHVYDPESETYNLKSLQAATDGAGVVLIEWAVREQGLVVESGNPLGIAELGDLMSPGVRLVLRQAEAGSQILLEYLLIKAGLDVSGVDALPRPARTESELATAIAEGKANAGLAVAAVAQQHGLDFIPLHRERYDLVMRRHDFFEPPVQTLLRFTRSEAFRAELEGMAGYDCSNLGRVVFNGS